MIYVLQPLTSTAWENLFNFWSVPLPYVQIYVNLMHTNHLSELPNLCQKYIISSLFVFSNMHKLIHWRSNYIQIKTKQQEKNVYFWHSIRPPAIVQSLLCVELRDLCVCIPDVHCVTSSQSVFLCRWGSVP